MVSPKRTRNSFNQEELDDKENTAMDMFTPNEVDHSSARLMVKFLLRDIQEKKKAVKRAEARADKAEEGMKNAVMWAEARADNAEEGMKDAVKGAEEEKKDSVKRAEDRAEQVVSEWAAFAHEFRHDNRLLLHNQCKFMDIVNTGIRCLGHVTSRLYSRPRLC
ncbi:hypothetical protein PF008_g10079 [Phytophthora fragariae]|uniref:Uncharacterized protein n=1 Tax=Phytophthora fragariae TaxID=53985 RepID=A0A6G0RUY3_9STRA|nr:hypothetical protein PF008_g10079 [Phytophthora fragariae]